MEMLSNLPSGHVCSWKGETFDPRGQSNGQLLMTIQNSDIIAELSELPHSGISRREDTMPLPRWSTVDYAPDAPETMIMIYYSAQINLRKILNRAHSALYSSGSKSLEESLRLSVKSPGRYTVPRTVG